LEVASGIRSAARSAPGDGEGDGTAGNDAVIGAAVIVAVLAGAPVPAGEDASGRVCRPLTPKHVRSPAR